MDIPLTQKQKKAIYMETYMVKYSEEKQGSNIEPKDDLPRENTYLFLWHGGAEKLPNATPWNLEAQESVGAALKLNT